MTAEKRTRRKYTEDFKRDAVALITEQGYKIAEAARSLGIGGDLIRRWKREFEDEVSGARLGTDEQEELKQLRKEVCLLRMEKDIVNTPPAKAGLIGHTADYRHYTTVKSSSGSGGS